MLHVKWQAPVKSPLAIDFEKCVVQWCLVMYAYPGARPLVFAVPIGNLVSILIFCYTLWACFERMRCPHPRGQDAKTPFEAADTSSTNGGGSIFCIFWRTVREIEWQQRVLSDDIVRIT